MKVFAQGSADHHLTSAHKLVPMRQATEYILIITAHRHAPTLHVLEYDDKDGNFLVLAMCLRRAAVPPMNNMLLGKDIFNTTNR